MALRIKWNRRALDQFDAFIRYIDKDSPANAKKVRKAVLLKIQSLSEHPEQYAPDKYKTANDGTFKAFELDKCRISYRFTGSEIRIIHICHTK